MIKVDEDALICDLAETYQIYDYRQLPATLVAVFSYGLKNDSRIKMKLMNQEVSLENLLLAGINDKLNTLIWFKTKDGQKGKNKPNSLVDALAKKDSQQKGNLTFTSGQEFEELRQKLLMKGG